jgi:hypothetical protein
MVGELDDAALAAFAASIPPGVPVLMGELRHIGGALARTPEHAGALGRLDGAYILFGVGLVMGPETAAPVAAALEAFEGSLAGYATASSYPNFSEQPTDTAAFYSPDAYARLRALRAAVDPDGRMVANHPIPA